MSCAIPWATANLLMVLLQPWLVHSFNALTPSWRPFHFAFGVHILETVGESPIWLLLCLAPRVWCVPLLAINYDTCQREMELMRQSEIKHRPQCASSGRAIMQLSRGEPRGKRSERKRKAIFHWIAIVKSHYRLAAFVMRASSLTLSGVLQFCI